MVQLGGPTEMREPSARDFSQINARLRARVRSPRWSALLVFIIIFGVLLRAGVARKALEVGATRVYSDSATYLVAADGLRSFIESFGTARDFRLTGLFVRGPVYPAFLVAAGDGLTGGDTSAVALQVVLSGFMIWLVYLLGDALIGPGPGVLAALFVAGFPILVDLPSVILTEAVRAPAVVATLFVLAQFRRRPTMAAGIAVGLLITLLAMAHSSTFLLAIPLLLWAVACGGRFSRGAVPVLVGPLACAVGLWVLGTVSLYGHVLLPGQGGIGFGGGGGWTAFISSRPSTDGQYLPTDYEFVEPSLYPKLNERVESGAVEPEIAQYVRTHVVDETHPIPDSVFWSAYIDQAARDPIGFARITAIKAWRLVMDPWVVLPPSATFFGVWAPGYFALHVLAVLGIIWPHDSLDIQARLLLLLIPMYFVAVFGLTTPEGRYWWPALPIMAIFAALGVIRSVTFMWTTLAYASRRVIVGQVSHHLAGCGSQLFDRPNSSGRARRSKG